MTLRLLCTILVGFILLTSPASADWIEAGPIWNNIDAQRKCPKTCGNGKWDGNWKTIQEGKMSVCNCPGVSRSTRTEPQQSRVKPQRVSLGKKKPKGGVDAGAVWNDMMAEQRCPAACKSRRWDGRWSYIDISHSICYCR